MRLDEQLDRACQDLLRVSHQLPQTLVNMRDAMAGHPPAQTYDTPRVGGFSTVLDDEGIPMPAVSDRTGENGCEVYMGHDDATKDHRELSRLIRQAEQVADRLIRLSTAYAPRAPSMKERDETKKANEKEPGCEACAKVGRWNVPHTTTPTTVAGNLDEPWVLCRWHYEYVRKTGRLATDAETKQWLDRPVDKAVSRAVAS